MMSCKDVASYPFSTNRWVATSKISFTVSSGYLFLAIPHLHTNQRSVYNIAENHIFVNPHKYFQNGLHLQAAFVNGILFGLCAGSREPVLPFCPPSAVPEQTPCRWCAQKIRCPFSSLCRIYSAASR